MTSMYPNIPGFTINHDPTKVDFKKISAQMLQKISNNEIQPKKNLPLPRQNEIVQIPTRNQQSLSSSQQTYVNHFGPNITEHFQPDYVKLDKQVLRFKGFFKESVVESSLENARIRKLVICYYLVDDTVSIDEMRIGNAGIIQGPFLKRMKIKFDDYRYLNFKDIQVGERICIYGKYITIYECDEYSREFYRNVGIEQGESLNPPDDFFSQTISQKFRPQRDNIMKDYLEHKLGGGKVHSQKQFLENDRKVLKFYAKYETLKYYIHYYLADDTVEIREVHHPNSGRDNFPLFLKRKKLPRKFAITQPGEIGEFDFYKDNDIEPFMTLWAFNRPFKILGCDPFTQQYYMDNYNKKFPLGGFEDPPSKNKNNIIIPPYNGFGDEEDSLGNCIRLVPKQPKKDYFKYIDNDKVILRFLARLNTKVPEDIDRRFLISFFMSDDSIQVYEMFNRNSGIWEGKFLERKRYKNLENENMNFTISDFEVNKSIRVNTFSFHIMDADDYTKQWMANNLK